MKYIWILGVLIFGMALFNGFVGDDSGYINHPYIQKFQLIKLVTGSSSDLGGSSPITGSFYRPAMLIMLSALYQIFHQQAFGYHFFQISLHIANASLVYFLFRNFFKKKLSLFLALIFLVHPINAETVLYVSNLQDVLMMTFGLLGILWYWPFLLLALLAKETGILFLVMALIVKRANWIRISGILATYIVIRLAAGVGTSGGISRYAGFSPDIILYYLKTFFAPVNLAIGQTWMPTNNIFKTIIFLLIIFIITAVLIRKRNYKMVFFTGWTVLGLLPHLQIIPLEMTVADRWFYFSGIGLIGVIGVMGKNFKNWVWISIIMLLAIRTVIRIPDFKNYERLLTHDSSVTESYLLEQALGYVQNSKEHTLKSIAIYPNPVNTNTLGVLYFRENNLKEAEKWFRKSITLGDNFQSFNNLARISISQEKWAEAEKIISAGQQKFPNSDNFWFLEAIVRYKQGETTQALQAIQEALKISKSQQNLYIYQQLVNNKPIQIN